MAQIVLTDATPLIYLSQTSGGLSWLSSLFGPASMTRAVKGEVLPGRGAPGEAEIDAALERGDLRVLIEDWPKLRFPWLHEGEASTIRAAINLNGLGHTCLVLMDDRAGRDEIKRLGSGAIIVSGTVAVICRAKEVGLIFSAKDVFEELRQKGFRVSDDILSAALGSVKEATGGKGSVSLASRKSGGAERRKRRP